MVAAACIIMFWPNHPKSRHVASSSTYLDGRLWTKIATSNYEGVALIDTGASRSFLTEDFLIPETRGAETSVETRFGAKPVPTFTSTNILFIEENKPPIRVFKSLHGYSVIGNDYLLSKRRILLTSDRIISFRPMAKDSFSYCSGAIFDYAGRDTNSNISAIYIQLPINGVNQKVLIDTGRNAFFEATAFANTEENPRARGIDLTSDAIGRSRLEWFGYMDVNITIGDVVYTYKIRHFFENTSVDAPYIIGSRFLEKFDIYIDVDNGRVCLREAQSVLKS